MKTRHDQEVSQKLAEFEGICRQKGLKLTHQRLEIYRELLHFANHPTAETIYNRVRRHIPTISLDTVYRTLALLEEAGMIVRIQSPESHARFETDSAPHHHLLCKKCQQITDFTWHAFDTMPPPPALQTWGEISRKNIVVEGVCNDCLHQGKGE